MVSGSSSADVIVIGGGLIGLSTAFALGKRGVRTVVLDARSAGAASPASAGLLVPSVGQLANDVRPFFLRSLAMYPDFVAALAAFDSGLHLIQGLIERDDRGRDTIHPNDGAIDNVRLLAALRAACDASTVRIVHARAAAVGFETSDATVVTDDDARYTGAFIVLAAGAWSPRIRGLPRPLPVQPLKGQMIALGAAPLRQPVMGRDVYLVPRGEETLVGATVEHAGFDVGVTEEAIEGLRAGAGRLCAELASAPVVRSWAGIRPATPDMLPILGPDPLLPALVYACGHSKNGVLLAPASAEAVADWCTGSAPAADVDRFSISRFA